MPSMLPMLAVLMMIMILYTVDGPNHNVGRILNYALGIFDFGGEYPVLTLMLVGSIMVILSTGLRTLMMDSLAQAKSQHVMSAFNKEMRQARIENNLYKVKKLTEMQPQMMAASMESSGKMMKAMPITMAVVIPIFLWIRYFVDITLREAGNQIIQIPWSVAGVSLTSTFWFLPAWILVYTLISIPLGQVITRIVKVYQFRKRLHELEAGAEFQ
ncbi:MAG: DUF106 domain-containing protein [Thermoplasmatales archaeon]|nr:DUF106 domain-containing protein [Thermoplasmatales archaeon]